ncbi:FecR protein [Gimesia panareensis]|uniref:FecR protein n=1 Tax=Gimesia panareensis TaxID=2527978 RepID=A0A518FUA5_9PLAN|nr:hypothetical protein [Gimesia panareensis]QDV19908.1 FecR protein [Gimesia panareensis]
MSVQDIPPRFDELLNQFLDDKLSADEFAEFEKNLLENPQARKLYFDLLDINSGIDSNNHSRLQKLDQVILQGINASAAPRDIQQSPTGRSSFSTVAYLLVAAASVCIILLAEWLMTDHFFWNQPVRVAQKEKQEEAVPLEMNQPYVATLSRSFDCKWGNENPPRFSGQRLLSKNLTLLQGIAEFRFDSGVRLVLEGPTTINIDSATCATVASGSVVLHGYESSPEFELITPQARFYDIGTEYGAKVDEQGGTELHVFQGAVRVQPEMELAEISAPLVINEGNARLIEPESNKEIHLDPDRFKREVPGQPKALTAVRKELLAYDSFHPPQIADPPRFSDWRNSGFGWTTHWRNGVNKPDNAPGKSLPERSLQPDLKSKDQSGCIELERGNTAWRSLEKPIRLDTDAIYYVSFFIQQAAEPTASGYHYGNISLQSEEVDKLSGKRNKLLFGINSQNYPTLSLKGQTLEKAPPLLPETTYFYVAKIVASENAPDQIFLRAFYENETIPDQEPLIWTCISTPFDDSNTYPHVRIHAGKSGKYRFDELRIGSSWESVVNLQDPAELPE